MSTHHTVEARAAMLSPVAGDMRNTSPNVIVNPIILPSRILRKSYLSKPKQKRQAMPQNHAYRCPRHYSTDMADYISRRTSLPRFADSRELDIGIEEVNYSAEIKMYLHEGDD